MLFGLRTILVTAIAALAAASTHATVPIEVYGQDREVSDVQISADGTKLAMARSENGKAGVFIVERGTNKTQQYNFGDSKIRDIEWSSPHHLLVYVTKTTNVLEYASTLTEYCGVFSIDSRASTPPKQLLGSSENLAFQSSLCGIESRLWTEKGEVLMSARTKQMSERSQRGGGLTGDESVLRVNGDTGRGNVIARGGPLTAYWVGSPKGYLVARIDYAQNSNRHNILVPTDEDKLGGWKTIFTEQSAVPDLYVHGSNGDETALIVSTYLKTGLRGLFEMSLTDGSIQKPLFEPDGVDVGTIQKDPYTGTVVGAHYTVDREEQIFFQNDLQGMLVAAKAALPGWDGVHVVSWDQSRQTFVIFAEGTKSAGTYFIVDRAKGRIERLADQRSKIKADDIAPVKAFTYKARDGLPICAFLTTPPGQDAKNLPLVVLPHGGPASRDSLTFDYWAQALASRGYAVLQMNFRGSSGYGAAFEVAGYREWGGKMQDDVTDGVRHVTAEGIADQARVCIVGGSYGGYAALAGAAFTPELYKCAVSVNGVTDLRKFMAYVAGRYGNNSAPYDYWTRLIGNANEEGAQVAARSPANAAENITAAVMLIHGKDDTTVPFDQSERMHDALKEAKKSVQLVKLDGEDHYLSRAKTRTEMLQALDGFLAQHIGPEAAKAQAKGAAP